MRKDIIFYKKDELKVYLEKNNFRNINDKDMEACGEYYINPQGEVLKLLIKKDYYVLRKVSISKGVRGYKLNIHLNGLNTVKQIHDLLYKTFKPEYSDSRIIFLDGNDKNCCLENLISERELIEFFLKNK